MTLFSWASLLGLITGEGAVLVLLASLISRLSRPAWQRSIWHSVILGLSLILVLECSGGKGRLLKIFVFPVEETQPERRIVVTTFSAEHPRLNADSGVGYMQNDAGSFNQPASKKVWWPGWVWLGGAIAFAARSFLSRFCFLVMRHRRRSITNDILLQRIKELSHRLGLRRTVHVTESSALKSPVVFGVFRFGICLPEGFASDFSPAQQEAMLAHELAHLAYNDPAWYCLMDLTTALWWWNPFMWWTRRQLQSATEQAADEASLLLVDGPGALAECLVQIGRSLGRARSVNLLGIEGNGFRSGLGRRVARLLALEGARVGSISGGKKAFLYLGSMSLLLLMAIVTSGWAPREEALAETAWDAIASKHRAQLMAQAKPQKQNPHQTLPGNPGPPAVDPETGLPTTNTFTESRSTNFTAESLHTRWFKVDPIDFLRELRGIKSAEGTKSETTVSKPSADNKGSSEFEIQEVMNFFKTAGVDLMPPKAIFYNDRLGALMVRGTLQDLDIVEQAIQVLSMTPPQLTIDCKFVEISAQSSLMSWLQKQGIDPSNNPMPAKRGPTDFSPPSGLKVLTPALYRELVKETEQSKTDVLTTPRITTLSGRQAQLKVVDVKSIVTDLDYEPSTNGAAPVIQPITEQIELGTTLDVVPRVSADGYTVFLTLIPSIKEFLGYDHENAKKLLTTLPGLAVEPPLAMFRHRVAPSSAVAWDGQTVLLYLGSVESTSASEPKAIKHRIVLVTPTLIDAAGNAIHTDADAPFRTTGTPPQLPPK